MSSSSMLYIDKDGQEYDVLDLINRNKSLMRIIYEDEQFVAKLMELRGWLVERSQGFCYALWPEECEEQIAKIDSVLGGD